MDFVSPLLDLTCRLCGCIGNYTKYMRHLKYNLSSLRTEMEKLMEQKTDVKTRVDSAESQHMQRTEQVNGWLRRIDQLQSEVEVVLQQGDEEIQNKCLKICPRNCVARHRFGKKARHLLQTVSDMKNEGNFTTVAVTLPRVGAKEMPLETTVGLDSHVNEVLSFVRDDGVGIIGIYGMGGVGKTTLLKKLNNELATQLSSGEFDEVIWVVVSKSKDLILEKVQDKIGKTLGFPKDIWRDKSQDEKQADIFSVLKRKKFVLLLDDIWDRLDLLQVGVPLPDNQNKAKVVFTTRSEQVCGLMEVQKKIKIECLSWEKAWDLFQRKVFEEILNSNPAIRELAQVVCKECGGLPLALITIGRAMSSKKTLQEWHNTIRVLKKSTPEFSGMGDNVLPLLKFSYDSLSDETTRTCFLYCSFFPEDWSIPVYLIKGRWMGEGFLDECDNIDEALSLGHDIIGRLKLACLLESSELGSDYFKIHDVIRDMALWILSESGKKYLVQVDLKLHEAPALSKWEEAERISLMYNSIEELSGTPRCPNLLSLILHYNALTTISDSFFQFMPALKVLDLSHNRNLTDLPASIFGLPSLQSLDMSGTSIKELPIEFKSLIKLKYLYLNHMTKLDIIPAEVMSSLLPLRMLEMRATGVSEGIDESSIFNELECLNHLQFLGLTVKSEHALQILLNSHKLQSCTFQLVIEQYRDSSSLQMSSLQKNIKRLEYFQIRNCDGLEELLMDWMSTEERERAAVPHKYSPPWDISKSIMDGSRSFHNLLAVTILKCKVLKDLTWLISAPNLQSLGISKCDAMEEVIKDVGCSSSSNDIAIGIREGGLNVFSRLHRLSLLELPELKSICRHPLPFPSLTKIEVSNCPKLKKLPFDSNSGKDTLRSIECEKEWWDNLEWENQETHSVFIPLLSQVKTELLPIKKEGKSRTGTWR